MIFLIFPGWEYFLDHCLFLGTEIYESGTWINSFFYCHLFWYSNQLIFYTVICTNIRINSFFYTVIGSDIQINSYSILSLVQTFKSTHFLYCHWFRHSNQLIFYIVIHSDIQINLFSILSFIQTFKSTYFLYCHWFRHSNKLIFYFVIGSDIQINLFSILSLVQTFISTNFLWIVYTGGTVINSMRDETPWDGLTDLQF